MSSAGSSKSKRHPYDQLRALFRSHWSGLLSQRQDEAQLEKRFPFEGGLYTEAEILKLRDDLKTRDRELMVDLVLVACASVAVLGVLALLILVLLMQ